MPSPTIRGSGIQFAVASSYTVSWPAGTLAGDLAVIFAENGFHYTTPATWAEIYNVTGSPVSGAVFTKILTAADISTGHVVIAASGSFGGTLAIATFVGAAFIAFWQNGVVQASGIDFTLAGAAIAFTTAPKSTPQADWVRAEYVS